MNRANVLRNLSPLVEGRLHDVRDASTSRIVVTPDMVQIRPKRGGPALEVADRKTVADFLKFPIGLADKLSPDTYSRTLTDLVQHTGRYAMVVKDDKVTSLVPFDGGHRPVDPEHLLDVIERTIPVEDYMRVMVTDQVASLEIAGERTEVVVDPQHSHIARGDLVKAGVMVTFSPMGVAYPTVQSYAVRLVCTNGATANTVLASFTGGGGEGDSIWQFFRRSIHKAYGSFDKVVTGWRELAAEDIDPERRATILENLIKAAALSDAVADAVRAQAIAHPPTNAWEMQNLLTYATTHLMERARPRQIAKALRVVADFGDEQKHAELCPLCHHRN